MMAFLGTRPREPRSRRAVRSRRRAKIDLRPVLESLEGRIVLSGYTVDSTDYDPTESGTLGNAINQAVAINDPAAVITFALPSHSTIQLSAVDQSANSTYGPTAYVVNGGLSGVNITIDGSTAPGLTIDGTGQVRLFAVLGSNTSLTLENLTLNGGLAQGGDGGSVGSGGGGGGGAGLGGAVYDDSGSFTADGVTFTNNLARGGDGGSGGNGGQVGGGGGGFDGGAGTGVGGQGGYTMPGGNGGFGGGGGGGGIAPSHTVTNSFPTSHRTPTVITTPSGNTTLTSVTVDGTGSSTSKIPATAQRGGNGGFGGGGGGGASTRSRGQTGGNGGFGGGWGASGNPSGSGGGGGGGGGAGLGGAIFSSVGSITLVNDTFTGNTASGGAGGTDNSDTVQGAPGSGYGGAVFVRNGYLHATFDTFSSNTVVNGDSSLGNGSDVFLLGDGNHTATSAVLVDDILGQAGSSTIVDFFNTTYESGTRYNLAGSQNDLVTNPASGASGLSGSNIIGGNPDLAGLYDYGGPTPTMALQPGSPAIGGGVAADFPDTMTAITTDQRGVSRITPPDLGAYEHAADRERSQPRAWTGGRRYDGDDHRHRVQ